MRSNGLATIMLVIPILTVPALAIFGIPQFAPVVASPLEESLDLDGDSHVRKSESHTHDDLFDDAERFGSPPESAADSIGQKRIRKGAARTGVASSRSSSTSDSGWDDDLNTNSAGQGVTGADGQEVRNSASGNRSAGGVTKSDVATPNSRKSRGGISSEESRAGSPTNHDQNANQVDDSDDLGHRNSMSAKGGRNRLSANQVPGTRRGKSTSESTTWAAAIARLEEFQIRNFRIEPGHERGQFVFICSYTPPDSPRVSYRFEADADEPLKAVEKVIDQIVEWRQER